MQLFPIRWNLCVDKVNDALGLAVSAAYVQRHLSKETKTDMHLMIKRVKTAFRSILKGFKWLPAVTKSEIHSTLNSMRFFIGHPKWILNKTSLEKYYQGVSYLSNKLIFSTFYFIYYKAGSDCQSNNEQP